ncbi:MAG: glycosyl transferase family 1 [Litorilinea sp.]|nr:MAG: glycosyl transferase family 1 [Litorilinea sp.]
MPNVRDTAQTDAAQDPAAQTDVAAGPRRRVWLLSPYHTGSHRSWAEGYLRHSRHQVSLLTMAGRFWKWRMQGGALELAAQVRERLATAPQPDCIVATDMVNLPTWLGLLRRHLPSSVPVLLYMHENQLTYPWRPGERKDLTYAMINWQSQVAADAVAFNSHFHLESWFSECPRLLKHFPDYNHLELVEEVRQKSHVLPVGIDARRIVQVAQEARPRPQAGAAPLILWNQRWEYDKRPDRFFRLLYRLAETGHAFRLAVAGENFRQVPEEFEEARQRLASSIVHWGYVPSYQAYLQLLAQADLVISTADHEFFGISVLEAVTAGAFPLLPRRLSYPELIPAALHPACLYEDDEDLFQKTAQRLRLPRPAPPSLVEHVLTRYDWGAVAPRYDALVERLAAEAMARHSSQSG